MSPVIPTTVVVVALLTLLALAVVLTGLILWATRCTREHCDEHPDHDPHPPTARPPAHPVAPERESRTGPRSPFTVRHSAPYLPEHTQPRPTERQEAHR